MDRIDRKILAEMQKNGRISLTELADKIGISLSPCQRRVKQLEQNGVIQGYQTVIDPKAVGLDFSAIVFVTLKNVVMDDVAKFELALQDLPEIIQAQRLFGDIDYILHIVTPSLESFQLFYDKKLTSLPNVLRLSSTLVMKEVVPKRALPLKI
ncbi:MULTISPECIES: Lrp/AsnC family transcriptional regulator [Glaesserella]|uniref:AsnC family transcriptional regulator n=1 Tax=Glaesserella australis TaxID=2094024 RepID=A0A328C195_9PAST|nr:MULTISPECIES: Lrp/AsnC family transcriptional regulator [Glaesserella]AUI66016.1 AsnC family transcriptional regulator [Glaesserella sp. 15-184]RAL18264.1 AsnC family transcriptional regulator [Glaesserella australis]